MPNKPEWLKREYVCMKNSTDASFVNHGLYDPVVIEGNRRPMSDKTTVVITGGSRVGCNEDISSVGRLTQKSYLHLLRLWQNLSKEAQNEPWV